MTAARRREQASADHRARMADCATHRVLDRIGDKWLGLLLKELSGGPRRSAELRRSIAGASQKMLTQTLRGLERDGLVTRSVTASVPARVDYALTELGQSLLPVLAVVAGWAERHIGDIDAARARYDAADGGAGR